MSLEHIIYCGYALSWLLTVSIVYLHDDFIEHAIKQTVPSDMNLALMKHCTVVATTVLMAIILTPIVYFELFNWAMVVLVTIWAITTLASLTRFITYDNAMKVGNLTTLPLVVIAFVL